MVNFNCISALFFHRNLIFIALFESDSFRCLNMVGLESRSLAIRFERPIGLILVPARYLCFNFNFLFSPKCWAHRTWHTCVAKEQSDQCRSWSKSYGIVWVDFAQRTLQCFPIRVVGNLMVLFESARGSTKFCQSVN